MQSDGLNHASSPEVYGDIALSIKNKYKNTQNIGHKYPSFDMFYLRISAILKWKTLLPHKYFPKTTLGRCCIYFIIYLQSFQILERNLWQPYLSLCLQKLSPLPGGLNFEAQNLAIA